MQELLQADVKGFVTATDEEGNVIGGWVYGTDWFISFNKESK